LNHLLLLFIVSLYPLVQAEEPCPEGYMRGPSGTCSRPKCDSGQVVNSKGICVPKNSHDNVCVDCFESCVYVGVGKITKSAMSRSVGVVTKCPPTIEDNAKSCGMVDFRCDARVRCYPKRVGGDYGVNLPPVEMGVTCSMVNGRCPEDPKDCMEDGTVTVTREPSNDDMEGSLQNISDDNLEVLRDALRKSRRGSSRGVR